MSSNKRHAMTYGDILSYLDTFTNYERTSDFTCGPETMGISRIEKLLELVGSPQKNLPCVHIAGTKGKGSVSHMTSALLTAAGLKVGLYTSPHVLDLRERIMFDRRPISRELFCKCFNKMRPAIDVLVESPEWKAPTYFEIITTVAFLAFMEEEVDVAVLEVGMGGRFDATNVVTPKVCGITPISLDHTRQLGNTLQQIASEKCGIIKSGVPVVVGPQSKAAMEVIKERCLIEGCRLVSSSSKELHATIKPSSSHAPDRPQEFDMQTFMGRYTDIRMPLIGQHQIDNAAIACGLAETFLNESEYEPFNSPTVRRAFRNIHIPARLEIIGREPWTLIDGAHNAASAWVLSEAIRERFAGRRLALVFGAARDKDIAGMLRILAPLSNIIFTTESGNQRALSARCIADLVPEKLDCTIKVINDPLNALELAKHAAGAEGIVCVTGSMYLAGRILLDLERKQAAAH